MYGPSSQDVDYQQEAVTRLRLPFPLVSDTTPLLARLLGLPSFAIGGLRLYRRLTLVIRGGRIEHVFYPIFPPDPHAQQVLDWLHTHPTTTPSTRRGDG
ncbi:hypothetical protein ACIBI9_64950 [Nonomuraea sp. NPDC050451]|uniref:hypothetical protein n=1 Tax=Nonomuraea sp. NPDC050451 TaxID=3364364 RepID=UPI00379045AA